MSFRSKPLPLVAALMLIGQSASVLAQTSEKALHQINFEAEKGDFDSRQNSTRTELVYGREELDRMNEPTVAVLALLAVAIAIVMLCHGFWARAQMKRYQQIHAATPAKRKPANSA